VSNEIREEYFLYFEIYLYGLFCSCAFLKESHARGGIRAESDPDRCSITRLTQSGVCNAAAIHAGSGEKAIQED
jgi:hypothetical protein